MSEVDFEKSETINEIHIKNDYIEFNKRMKEIEELNASTELKKQLIDMEEHMLKEKTYYNMQNMFKIMDEQNKLLDSKSSFTLNLVELFNFSNKLKIDFEMNEINKLTKYFKTLLYFVETHKDLLNNLIDYDFEEKVGILDSIIEFDFVDEGFPEFRKRYYTQILDIAGILNAIFIRILNDKELCKNILGYSSIIDVDKSLLEAIENNK